MYNVYVEQQVGYTVVAHLIMLYPICILERRYK